jgi:hypothetical protein
MSTIPTRLQLRLLAQKLRGADTRPFPMSVAEAVQHCIVRLESLAADPQSPEPDICVAHDLRPQAFMGRNAV